MSETKNNISAGLSADEQNAAQYIAYPYPERVPEHEQQRLLATKMDCLDLLNHRAFGGQRDFSRSFRVLVAGGGTGDSVIFLAEQLRHTKNRIDYIDLSEASLSIAKKRAEARGLSNINWRTGSLLTLNPTEHGYYDYINCSGVLHHLAEPEAGLLALKGVLAEGGAIGLMVYGKYARAGVYQFQSLLKLLLKNERQDAQKLLLARKILNGVPDSNLFKRTEVLFDDHNQGDAGFFDLLLHQNDQAYSIADVYSLLATVNLGFNGFVSPNQYSPGNNLIASDTEVKSLFAELNGEERAHAVELLSGAIKKHEFYARNELLAQPSPANKRLIPSLALSSERKLNLKFSHWVKQNSNRDKASFTFDGKEITLKTSPLLAASLQYLDGAHSLEQIYQAVSKELSCKVAQVENQFLDFYKRMNAHDLLFLRSPKTNAYRHIDEMELTR